MKTSILRAKTVPEFEQLLIVNREERSLQRREDGEFVVGPFDGGERGPNRLHFLTTVKRFPADEQVRDAARFDRIRVLARDVLAEADESSEQNRDVPRLNRHAHFRTVAMSLAHVPPVSGIDKPRHERPDRVG
jgi:hypothetical protein